VACDIHRNIFYHNLPSDTEREPLFVSPLIKFFD
jgi:hypothetical protein